MHLKGGRVQHTRKWGLILSKGVCVHAKFMAITYPLLMDPNFSSKLSRSTKSLSFLNDISFKLSKHIIQLKWIFILKVYLSKLILKTPKYSILRTDLLITFMITLKIKTKNKYILMVTPDKWCDFAKKLIIVPETWHYLTTLIE